MSRPKPKRSRARKGAVSAGTPKPMKNQYFFAGHLLFPTWFFNPAGSPHRKPHTPKLSRARKGAVSSRASAPIPSTPFSMATPRIDSASFASGL